MFEILHDFKDDHETKQTERYAGKQVICGDVYLSPLVGIVNCSCSTIGPPIAVKTVIQVPLITIWLRLDTAKKSVDKFGCKEQEVTRGDCSINTAQGKSNLESILVSALIKYTDK